MLLTAISPTLAKQVINHVKSYHDCLPAKPELNFSFRLIDTEETTSVISNLKNKSRVMI